jgi:hypothetical protein
MSVARKIFIIMFYVIFIAYLLLIVREKIFRTKAIGKTEVLGGTDHLLSFGMTRITWKTMHPKFSVVACLFVGAVTLLPSRCLATIERYI